MSKNACVTFAKWYLMSGANMDLPLLGCRFFSARLDRANFKLCFFRRFFHIVKSVLMSYFAIHPLAYSMIFHSIPLRYIALYSVLFLFWLIPCEIPTIQCDDAEAINKFKVKNVKSGQKRRSFWFRLEKWLRECTFIIICWFSL